MKNKWLKNQLLKYEEQVEEVRIVEGNLEGKIKYKEEMCKNLETKNISLRKKMQKYVLT